MFESELPGQTCENEAGMGIRFQNVLMGLDDADDFNSLQLFGDIGRYCFHRRPLYTAIAKSSET
jgi:hypothetical protein